jgi:hypothetical protein
MKLKLPERRRFVRLDVPLMVTFSRGDHEEKIATKNISPVGFMVETPEGFDQEKTLSFSLMIEPDGDPVKVQGKVIWQNKINLEDGAPFDVGIDIVDVDDKGKNKFLRYLCDLLYGSQYKERT